MSESPQEQLLKLLVLIIPAGLLLLLLKDDEKLESHVLEETDDSWLVKTENYDAPLIDTVKPNPNVTITFGQGNGKVVIKSIAYNKEGYTEDKVLEIMKDKLGNCKRCMVTYNE